MMHIDGVTKRYGAVTAVDGVSLHVRAGEFFSLLGPSGCGKTTLLRAVAGFEHPDAGRIAIDGKDVTDAPPQRRPVAMVFQNYALFPTMTVGENVEYGLRVQKVNRRTRRDRVAQALARVDLAGLEERPVTQMSGGQQQRVALARAIAVRPRVLLFDEPLSNLDVSLREQTRRELKVLQHEIGTTSLYVTHDQQEALALSDRIAVMREGALQQVGTPEELYREPASAFVAGFLGSSNLIRDPHVVSRLTGGEGPRAGHVLSVRPEHLVPGNGEPGVRGRLRSRQFLGTYSEWWVEVGETSLRAFVEPFATSEDEVDLTAKAYRWVPEDDLLNT